MQRNATRARGKLTVEYIRTEIAQELNLYANGLISSTVGSAGIDLYVASTRPITIHPTIPEEIPTGLHLWIKDVSVVGLLVPRGSSKFRLTNTIGIIDSDYQGEYMVKALSNTDEPITLQPGDKFAQLLLAPIISPAQINFAEKDNFSEGTQRGHGRFGSTGHR